MRLHPDMLQHLWPRFAALLQPARLRLLCVGLLTASLLMLAFSFESATAGLTVWGPPLGADFAGFYTAATLLNEHDPEQLYDFRLQDQIYHELLPGLKREEQLPYVHPPFVALVCRPLAQLPYPVAYAVWLVLSASLYLGGLVLLRPTLEGLRTEEWRTVLLLALTFEPFLMECWIAGQLSACGFLCMALAWSRQQRQHFLQAGFALGLCLYKPTFLVLLVPMLVVTRSFRMLLGFLLMALLLAGLSLAGVGWTGCLRYPQALHDFASATSGGALILRSWKYVDLNSFLRILLGAPTARLWPLFVVLSSVPLWRLLRAWRKLEPADPIQWQLLWASTITWSLVLNVYVGVYDSLVVVQAVFLTVGVLLRRSDAGTLIVPAGLQVLLVLLYVTPWFSQHLARVCGVHIYTLLLFALGVYQLRLIGRSRVTGTKEDLRSLEDRGGRTNKVQHASSG